MRQASQTQQLQSASPALDQSAFWPVVPSVLWIVLAAVVLWCYRKEISNVLREVAFRLRSGAAVKFASVELGSIFVAPGPEVSQRDKDSGVRTDSGRVREQERRAYRERARDVMLVHRLYRSREERQLYDLVIYVVPHKEASLAGVSRVEYFLGRYWGNKVFPSIDRSRGFAIATAAYGPLLCTAEVFFNDGTSAMLHRYIDFEMGAWAPASAAGPNDHFQWTASSGG
jgi:hypothetical protein